MSGASYRFYKKNGVYYLKLYMLGTKNTAITGQTTILDLGMTLAQNSLGWSRLWNYTTGGGSYIENLYNCSLYVNPSGLLKIIPPTSSWTIPGTGTTELNGEVQWPEEIVLTGGV
jgi:hypothetical protein